MEKRRMRYRFAQLTCTVGAAALLIAAAGSADAQDRQSIRWATSSTGSYGYAVASSMVNILEEALGGNYTVTVNPYPSTTAAMKATMDGEAEIGYTADVGMSSIYAGEAGFENYEPAEGKLVHTWYAYPMESFMAVPESQADQYECLSDLDGEPVFFTPAGFMNWLNFRRMFDALGYEFNHVEIDTSTQADALEQGSIDGAVAYTTAGRSLSSYWRETELRAQISIVNPCPEEREKLQEAGLQISEVDPSEAFSQEVGVDTIYGVPILFAYNVRADMPEDTVHTMLTAFYEQREQLAEADPGFRPLARDFVGMQVAGIRANPDAPVHPGLARFLEDHDAWDDSWTVADGS